MYIYNRNIIKWTTKDFPFCKYPAAKTLYLMNLPVDQANSGAKYEFCYVFMVKVKFLNR